MLMDVVIDQEAEKKVILFCQWHREFVWVDERVCVDWWVVCEGGCWCVASFEGGGPVWVGRPVCACVRACVCICVD